MKGKRRNINSYTNTTFTEAIVRSGFPIKTASPCLLPIIYHLKRNGILLRTGSLVGYVKTAEGVGSELYALALEQAMRAFKQRNAWTSELEEFVRDVVNARNSAITPLPLKAGREVPGNGERTARAPSRAQAVAGVDPSPASLTTDRANFERLARELAEARRRLETAEQAVTSTRQAYRRLASRKAVRLGLFVAKPMKPAFRAARRARDVGKTRQLPVDVDS
jgi:hypothetical protein